MFDFAMDTIVFICLGYVIIGFAIGLVDRWQRTLQPSVSAAEISTPAPSDLDDQTTLTATPQKLEVLETEPVKTAPATQPKSIVHAVVPFRHNWERQTTNQLRTALKERNLKWWNARPDGKHLRKQEMVDMLTLREPYKPFACAS